MRVVRLERSALAFWSDASSGPKLQGRIDVALNLLTGWNWLSSLPLAAAGLARTDGTRWLVDLFFQ